MQETEIFPYYQISYAQTRIHIREWEALNSLGVRDINVSSDPGQMTSPSDIEKKRVIVVYEIVPLQRTIQWKSMKVQKESSTWTLPELLNMRTRAVSQTQLKSNQLKAGAKKLALSIIIIIIIIIIIRIRRRRRRRRRRRTRTRTRRKLDQ